MANEDESSWWDAISSRGEIAGKGLMGAAQAMLEHQSQQQQLAAQAAIAKADNEAKAELQRKKLAAKKATSTGLGSTPRRRPASMADNGAATNNILNNIQKERERQAILLRGGK